MLSFSLLTRFLALLESQLKGWQCRSVRQSTTLDQNNYQLDFHEYLSVMDSQVMEHIPKSMNCNVCGDHLTFNHQNHANTLS